MLPPCRPEPPDLDSPCQARHTAIYQIKNLARAASGVGTAKHCWPPAFDCCDSFSSPGSPGHDCPQLADCCGQSCGRARVPSRSRLTSGLWHEPSGSVWSVVRQRVEGVVQRVEGGHAVDESGQAQGAVDDAGGFCDQVCAHLSVGAGCDEGEEGALAGSGAEADLGGDEAIANSPLVPGIADALFATFRSA
jgi:hypothetical protein